MRILEDITFPGKVSGKPDAFLRIFSGSKKFFEIQHFAQKKDSRISGCNLDDFLDPDEAFGAFIDWIWQLPPSLVVGEII